MDVQSKDGAIECGAGSQGDGRFWLLAGLLMALSFAVYAGALGNGFTIDDVFIYADNRFVTDWRNLACFFDTRYFLYSNEASYRPLCTLSYFVDAAIWGPRAFGPHLTNLLLYALTGVAVFAVGRRLTRDMTAGLAGAAVFVLHPIHNEAVNSISFREDLMVGLLLPAAWLAWRRAERSSPWLWMTAAWGLYFAATMCKESAVVFPVLACILDWVESRGRLRDLVTRRRLTFLTGLAVSTVLFGLIRFHWMQFAGEAAVPRLGGSLAGTILAAVKIQAHYLLLFAWPVNLSALYPSSCYVPRADVVFALSAAALAVLAAALVAFRRSRLFVGVVLWWFVAMAPVANVYPIFNPMAERYLLLPSILPCLALGVALALALRSRWQKAAWPALVAFGAALTAVNVQHTPVWRDNLSIWTEGARRWPDSPTVLGNLASALFEAGEHDRAAAMAKRALGLAGPRFPAFNPGPTHVVLAAVRQVQGQQDEALALLKTAERFIPMRPDIDYAVFYNKGLIHDDQGRLTEALASYRRAAKIDPFRPDLWRKIAFCELRMGDRDAAAGNWSRAQKLDPAVPSFEQVEAMYRKSIEAAPRGGGGKDASSP